MDGLTGAGLRAGALVATAAQEAARAHAALERAAPSKRLPPVGALRLVIGYLPCLACGILSRSSYCPAHRPSRVSKGRGSGSQASAFRRATLAKMGGTCAVCGSTDWVEAHHVTGLLEGGSNDAELNGVALCFAHHREVERARRR